MFNIFVAFVFLSWFHNWHLCY